MSTEQIFPSTIRVQERIYKDKTLRIQEPKTKTIYQHFSYIPANDSSETAHNTAISQIVKWANERLPEGHKITSTDREFITVENGGQMLAQIASISSEKIWALRLTHPDRPFNERPAIPGRIWIVDIATFSGGEDVEFACRINCTDTVEFHHPVPHTQPRIISTLVNTVGLTDCLPITGQPFSVSSESDLNILRSIITSKDRKLPIVLLTQPEQRFFKETVRDYLLDQHKLARATLGHAHIILLPKQFSTLWREIIGKNWSAAFGSVRIYWPKIDISEDQPSSLDNIFSDRILKHQNGGKMGPDAYITTLKGRILNYIADQRYDFENCKFINSIKTITTERSIKETQDIQTLISLFQEENYNLKQEGQQLKNEAHQYFEAYAEIEKEKKYLTEEINKLKSRITFLENRDSGRGDSRSRVTSKYPTDYSKFEDWVAENLSNRITLHPRAYQGLKNAVYEDITLVCNSLILLAYEYRDIQLGVTGAREVYKTKLLQLGLKESKSIDESRAGAEGDQYFVKHPIGTQNNKFLERHLRKGTSRDCRHCLAIYFFWDSDSQQVVIGWLPSHLDNRLS